MHCAWNVRLIAIICHAAQLPKFCSADLPLLGRSAAVLGFLDEKPQTAKGAGLRYIFRAKSPDKQLDLKLGTDNRQAQPGSRIRALTSSWNHGRHGRHGKGRWRKCSIPLQAESPRGLSFSLPCLPWFELLNVPFP
jgi:hypothetical protein